MTTAKKAAKKTASKKAVKLPDGSGFMKAKVPAPAKKQAVETPSKLSSSPPSLFEVGAAVKIKGDKRTWHITVVNADNYGVEFRHYLPGMQETRNIPFSDAVKA
jgi:hypothetical protein